MFGVGPLELGIFCVIVLLVVGPERLPVFMKTVGKGLREVRRAANDFRQAVALDDLMRDPPQRPKITAPEEEPVPRDQHELEDEDLKAQAPASTRVSSIPPPPPSSAPPKTITDTRPRTSSVPPPLPAEEADKIVSSLPPPLPTRARKSSAPPPAPMDAYRDSIVPEEEAS